MRNPPVTLLILPIGFGSKAPTKIKKGPKRVDDGLL